MYDKAVGVAALLIIAAALPLTVLLTQQSQNLQQQAAAALPAPTGLKYSCATTISTAVTFQWNKVDGASRYQIKLDNMTKGLWNDGGPTNPGDSRLDSQTNLFTYTALIPGDRYRWWLQAFDAQDKPGAVRAIQEFTCGTPKTQEPTAAPTKRPEQVCKPGEFNKTLCAGCSSTGQWNNGCTGYGKINETVTVQEWCDCAYRCKPETWQSNATCQALVISKAPTAKPTTPPAKIPTPTTAAGAPQGLSASCERLTGFQPKAVLLWRPPQNGKAKEYVVQLKREDQPNSTIQSIPTQETILKQPVTATITYVWKVIAKDAAGKELGRTDGKPFACSDDGKVIPTLTPARLPAPSNLQLPVCSVRDDGKAVVQFAWSKVDNAVKYLLRVDDTGNPWKDGVSPAPNQNDWYIDDIPQPQSGQVTYNSDRVLPAHTYRWWVHAKGSDPKSTSESVFGPEFTCPAPPSQDQLILSDTCSMNSTNPSQHEANLSWNRIIGATKYIVSISGGEQTRGIDTTQLTYTVPVQQSVAYTWQVTAYNGLTQVAQSQVRHLSCPKETAIATPPDVPIPPSCEVPPAPATLIPNGSIPPGIRTVAWSEVPRVTSYQLRINDETEGGWNAKCNNPDKPSKDKPNKGDVCENGLTTHTYSFDFKVGHTYSIWVHAKRENCGASQPVAARVTVLATTPTTTPSRDDKGPTNQRPLPPTGMEYLCQSDTTATLFWTNVPGALQYKILLDSNRKQENKEIFHQAAKSRTSSYIITFEKGERLIWWMRTQTAQGISNDSEKIAIDCSQLQPQTPPPANAASTLTLLPVTCSQGKQATYAIATLSWTQQSGAKKYQVVYLPRSANAGSQKFVDVGLKTTHEINAKKGTEYTWSVKAFDAQGKIIRESQEETFICRSATSNRDRQRRDDQQGQQSSTQPNQTRTLFSPESLTRADINGNTCTGIVDFNIWQIAYRVSEYEKTGAYDKSLDINSDGTISSDELEKWRSQGAFSSADIDQDNEITLNDFREWSLVFGNLSLDERLCDDKVRSGK